jgi:hypothetical protein
MLETASLSVTWCKSKSLPQQCRFRFTHDVICYCLCLSSVILCVCQWCKYYVRDAKGVPSHPIQDLVNFLPPNCHQEQTNKQTKIPTDHWLTRSKWLSQIWIESTKTTFKSSTNNASHLQYNPSTDDDTAFVLQ